MIDRSSVSRGVVGKSEGKNNVWRCRAIRPGKQCCEPCAPWKRSSSRGARQHAARSLSSSRQASLGSGSPQHKCPHGARAADTGSEQAA